MRELEYPFDAEYILKKKKSIKKELMKNQDGMIDIKIAILGGSTTNDIKLTLELFLLNHGLRPSFYESEYNQYFNDVMFNNIELKEFNPDIIYIHTSSRNIFEYPELQDDKNIIDKKINNVYMHFEQIWKKIKSEYDCQIIQNNFELPYYRLLGNKDASDIHGFSNFITRLNQKLYDYAYENDGFYIHDIMYEASDFGLSKWLDPYYWHMYKYAMCMSAIPYTAYQVANIIKSIYGKNKKAVALDMDNTLWSGIIGDDGVDNIEIGQETSIAQTFSEFQSYIKQIKNLGVLLTLNSKNNEEVALEGINRPDSIIKLNDITTYRINWEPKNLNLISMAKELNILPESFVFVDDNPAEREIVKGNVPGCAVPEMTEPEHYIKMIDRAGYFEVTNLSKDDLKRNDMYLANKQRAKEETSFDNYEDYLKALNMKGTIKAFENIYLSRIAQLTNKSNQFNLTTERYTLSEIETVTNSEDHITLYGKLEDKFGDNGVVSCVIGEKKKDELHMDLWIMSCRVLKRDMEFAMMDALVEECKKQKIKTIYGYYYPTKKNGMVKDFYAKQGFEKIDEDLNGNTKWKFEIKDNYENKNKVINVE